MKKKIKKSGGILYNGGYNNFSVNGSIFMEREVLYKNNPLIEGKKRLNMAYLLIKNPQVIDTIENSAGYFFHGTNANALPNILKYGLNSVNESNANNIPVTTGEEWSRIDGKRNFISLTDSLDVALMYANKDSKANDQLLNFSVVVGTSFENMNDIKASSINSDISEIGVIGNLSINHIKFLIVPEDKAEFVKKMVGQSKIEVIPMNMRDKFFFESFKGKLDILEKNKENTYLSTPDYPTYSREDVQPKVKERKISKIKEVFEKLKASKNKRTNDKNTNERS